MSPHEDTRTRWLLVMGAYLLIVLSTAFAFWQVQRVIDHACRERQSDRVVLTEIVDVATGNATGPVDLTKIGGFDQLTPSTQDYLRNLSRSLSDSSGSNNTPLHDRLTALLPPIRC